MKYIKQFYVNDYEGNVINDFNQYKQNKMFLWVNEQNFHKNILHKIILMKDFYSCWWNISSSFMMLMTMKGMWLMTWINTNKIK